MVMANTTPTILLNSGANIKHGAQCHLVQMQRYVSQDVAGGNMKLGSSGNGVTRSGERSRKLCGKENVRRKFGQQIREFHVRRGNSEVRVLRFPK